MGKMIWQKLYDKASENAGGQDISPFIYAGSVSAAILTSKGNTYMGISVDTSCSLGFCAERNAIGAMLTAGESQVTKVLALRKDQLVMPCGVCREYFMQLHKESKNIEFLVNLEPLETITLGELLPNWWADDRFVDE